MTHRLKEYSQFANNTEIYAAAKKHMSLHKNELTKSDCQVLDLILDHSAMHGVAQLTHPEIQNDTKKSNATVQRAMRKLVQLGIIEKRHYFNPVIGGLGANIYIVLPFKKGPQ